MLPFYALLWGREKSNKENKIPERSEIIKTNIYTFF